MSNQTVQREQGRASSTTSRAHVALSGIYEISKLLTRPARLEVTLSGVMNLLSSFLDMHNGLIALIDEKDETTAVVGAGWSEGTAREHFEHLPEQAVGQIVVSGMPLMVRNINESPLFSDWIDLNNGEPGVLRSFVGVPIKNEERTLGVIMIERQCECDLSISLDEDARFLTMVANLLGQTISLQNRVALDRERLMRENHRFEKAREQEFSRAPKNLTGIVGESLPIRSVIEKIQQVARCNLPVLLCGESGTGKELFARAIHEFSPRKDKPCIKVNCAALSETVLESELFGHEKGSFTGAVEARKGRFELANGGTLFLDEIGEISASFQAKLLRVLQEGEFERVGGSRTIKVDVRIVSATNRNLEEAVLAGTFRSDLYYRISVVPVYLPPLRDRKDDVPLLASEFLQRFNQEHGVGLVFSQKAMGMLKACDFPGNVRELESCVRRTAALAKDATIRAEDFSCANGECLSLMLGKSINEKNARSPFHVASNTNSKTREEEKPQASKVVEADESPRYPTTVAVAVHEGGDEKQRLVEAMERSGWVQAKAARVLGLTPRQMGYALRKYDIEIKRF